jgi:hypothetical protein
LSTNKKTYFGASLISLKRQNAPSYSQTKNEPYRMKLEKYYAEQLEAEQIFASAHIDFKTFSYYQKTTIHER